MGKDKTRRRKRGKMKRKEGEGEEKEGRERKESQHIETSFRGYPKMFLLGDIKLKLVWNSGPQHDSKDTCARVHVCLSTYIPKSFAYVSCVLWGLGKLVLTNPQNAV